MLGLCATGGFAIADPPATPAVPESAATPTQSSSGADTGSHGNNPVQSTPTAGAAQATTAVVAPANPDRTASDEQLTDRQLRSEGYKLAMVRGEERYCRRETPTGSHLSSVLHCVTIAEAQAMAKEAREVTQHIQHNTTGCLMGAHGCGN